MENSGLCAYGQENLKCNFSCKKKSTVGQVAVQIISYEYVLCYLYQANKCLKLAHTLVGQSAYCSFFVDSDIFGVYASINDNSYCCLKQN